MEEKNMNLEKEKCKIIRDVVGKYDKSIAEKYMKILKMEKLNKKRNNSAENEKVLNQISEIIEGGLENEV